MTGGRPLAAVTIVAVVLALVAACGDGQPAAKGPGTSTATAGSAGATPTSPVPPSTSTPSPSVPPASATPATPGISKVLVVVVENHSLDAMRQQMPYTFGLAQRYGYAVDYHAITHPSLPNYLAISGGDTFGVTDDHDPSAHPISTASVFGQALAAGRTAKVYADAMTGTCATTSGGTYAVRHNPWTYHVAERAGCRRYDVPITALDADVRAGRLPEAGMIVPDLCHDAHDCPAGEADAWLKKVVGGVLAGPDFASGQLLVVITADEDDHSQGNLVLTTLVNPQLHGVVARTPLDHYSLSRLYSQVLGVPALRRARTAPSMITAFRLTLAPVR